MRLEYEERIFDTFRSKVRERLGIDPPSNARKKRWIEFGDFLGDLFDVVCPFVVEYLLSLDCLNTEDVESSVKPLACSNFSLLETRLVLNSDRARSLVEQLYEFDEQDIIDSENEHELFSLVLDQIRNGEPSLQAAALVVVCSRVVNQKIWFYPLLKIRANQIVPVISIALRSSNNLVLERAVFAWTTFCAGNPKNFELTDYFRVLEIWENTKSAEVDDVAAEAVALVPESVCETIWCGKIWNKKMEGPSDEQINLLWTRTVESMVRVLAKYPPQEICCRHDFLCLLDSVISGVQSKSTLVELVKYLASHSNDVLGHRLKSEASFMRQFLTKVDAETFECSERQELYSFLQPYFGDNFRSAANRFNVD